MPLMPHVVGILGTVPCCDLPDLDGLVPRHRHYVVSRGHEADPRHIVIVTWGELISGKSEKKPDEHGHFKPKRREEKD